MTSLAMTSLTVANPGRTSGRGDEAASLGRRKLIAVHFRAGDQSPSRWALGGHRGFGFCWGWSGDDWWWLLVTAMVDDFWLFLMILEDFLDDCWWFWMILDDCWLPRFTKGCWFMMLSRLLMFPRLAGWWIRFSWSTNRLWFVRDDHGLLRHQTHNQ